MPEGYRLRERNRVRVGATFGGQFSQSLGHRRVVTRVEEIATGFNHGLVVARVAAVFVLHGQQVQVALTGAVKAMARRAGHAIVDCAEGLRTDRAGKHQASNLIRVW